jgi:hypothetical protein
MAAPRNQRKCAMTIQAAMPGRMREDDGGGPRATTAPVNGLTPREQRPVVEAEAGGLLGDVDVGGRAHEGGRRDQREMPQRR